MKKRWTTPQLIIIKRDLQESVLKVCKASMTSGPGGTTCGTQADLYCCYLAGKS